MGLFLRTTGTVFQALAQAATLTTQVVSVYHPASARLAEEFVFYPPSGPFLMSGIHRTSAGNLWMGSMLLSILSKVTSDEGGQSSDRNLKYYSLGVVHLALLKL